MADSYLYALTKTSYRLLRQLAAKEPELFINPNTTKLRARFDQECQKTAEPVELFDTRDYWIVNQTHLHEIISTAPEGGGPSRDATHARLFRQAFPDLKNPADAADPLVMASINTFHLDKYVPLRWESSPYNREDKNSQTEFVKSHWLLSSKESNTAQRLWWLHEFAHSAADHSSHTSDELLDLLANNVGLYHQMLNRPYLMASDRIRAIVIDLAEKNRLTSTNAKANTNRLMAQLNKVAGSRNLDVLDSETLKDIIEGCIFPKGQTEIG